MSDTPRTDAAREVYAEWVEYTKMYGHFPEAMEAAPLEADPFAFAETLETELAALRAENEELQNKRFEALRHLVNLQPHIAQFPEHLHSFIDAHVDMAIAVLEGTKEKK